MLLRNLDISQGLFNGAVGVVHDVDVSSSAKVERIYILFDDLSLSSTTTPSTTQLVAIDPIEQTFIYAGRSIVRTNFPLSLSWSCTIHKIQGATVDTCFMDLGSSVFEPGMAYVALSRVTSLQGLFLLKLNPDVIVANQLVLEEYAQLREKARHIS